MVNVPTTFHRHFSFNSFRHFLSPKLLKATWQKMRPHHRKRTLGLEGFLWLGLFLAAHTSLSSLQQIFDLAGRLPHKIRPLSFVSVSAFCQYRKHFPLKILMSIWQHLITKINQIFPSKTLRWKNLRLWAVDGTALDLPESLWPYFGSLRGPKGNGPAQSHLMVLYDLITRIPVAIRAGKAINNAIERPLFKRFLKHFKKGDLVVIDGGIYSFEIFNLLKQQMVHFLIPMQKSGIPELLHRFTKNDGLFLIKASAYILRRIPYLPSSMVVRIITVRRPGFRPKRLVTSLVNSSIYSAEDITQLYYQRWHIETFFREFKYALQATSWHAHTRHAFYTELIFQMLLVIVTRLAMAEASLKSGLPPGQLSFSRCLAEVKHFLTLTKYLPVKLFSRVYNELIDRLTQCRIDIRPGRRFERDRQKRRRQSRLRHLENSRRSKKHVA